MAVTEKDKSKIEPISLTKLGELLVKHYKLREGLYEVSIEFGLGIGNVGLEKGPVYPGVVAGVQRVGLVPVQDPSAQGPMIIDAGKVNPKRASKK